jgi:phosphoglycolate phosphatase-like HAD superfamily hydrolase
MRAIIFDLDHTLFAADNLYEGVAELLVILRRLGVKMGGLTTGDHRVVSKLAEHNVSHFFDSVITTDHMETPKAPDGVSRLLTNLGVHAHETVLVSHAHSDILLGKDAGLAKTIGVTHGAAGAGTLRLAGADHIVDSVPLVLDVLE